MYARVSTINGKPEQVDQAIDVFKQPNKPGLEAMKKAYVLVNRKSGKIVTVTLWETLEAIEASSLAANQIRGQAADIAGAQPTVEVFEVAVQE